MARCGGGPTIDAAFNMLNSFRHLQDESSAVAHLRGMSRRLRRGGLYIIGFHLTPTRGRRLTVNRRRARRGSLAVSVTIRSTQLNLKQQRETFVLTLNVSNAQRRLRLVDTFVYRTYTRAQLRRLLKKAPQLEWLETYDFTYDVNRPIVIGPDTEDVVLVLRKR
jgi:hypothetical protein